ncbi:MAG: ExeM/NucH family extracellular endonuclease [Planctomycetota bacterium]
MSHRSPVRLSKTHARLLSALVLLTACGCDPTEKNATPTTSATAASDQSLDAESVPAEVMTSTTASSRIAAIQGVGPQSSMVGSEAEITGVVTATYFERDELGGFFVQDMGQSDGGSSGIFVDARVEGLQVGETVKASGVVVELDGLTSIKPQGSTFELERVGTAENIEPVVLTSLEKGVDWESLEGMIVSIQQPMFVVDTYDLARRGRLVVAPEIQTIPTDTMQPDRDRFLDTDRALRAARITLDDGVTTQNKFPIPLVPSLGTDWQTVRVGSKLTGLTGVVIEHKKQYFLLPTADFELEPEPRPERPDVGDANVVVASFNVLNFFTTLDNGSNGARGADNPQELERQRDKLVAAMIGLEADVIGLMELENSDESEQTLVEALNQKLGTEAFAACGLPTGFSKAPGGGDRIRVGIIYRKDRVETVGDLAMIDDEAFFIARTPLVQAFRKLGGSESFTLIVNHFKSKGARDAKGEDRDSKDGQGAYNSTRTRQAKAVCSFVDQLVANGQPNALVIGDLNAYRFEDPIDAMREAGLVDLIESKCKTELPYTYVYFGQVGSLDQSFATGSLAEKVTGTEPWNINAAEPRFLDYNTEYNPKKLFEPNPFRSSDHDPVLIGLQLK